jgi:hypothetical protein
MEARAETPTLEKKYVSLEDLPPTRDKPAMTVNETSKLKKQLIEARDRQAAAAKAQDNADGN